MRKFFNIFLVIGVVLCFAQASSAENYKILVLPDNIQFESTNYYVYPDTSVIFASDTINEIKKDGRVQTVSMTEVRDKLRKNTKISVLTKNALKEFKYNYNIPFVDFKAIASCFDADKVLIITSQTDVQNYFLQRTLWDFLNIPGATVINPAYKLSTYAVLIDVNKEEVLWENLYYKKMASMENRMLAQNFAPATEQLEKIKLYSSSFLSPTVAKMVQAKILPSDLLITPEKSSQIVDVADVKNKAAIKNKTKNDGEINISNKTLNRNDSIAPILISPELKPINPIPRRDSDDGFGVLINDL